MRKSLLFLVLMLFAPVIASAHTGLEEVTPGDGETVGEEVNEIVLRFNTALEPGSTVTVENSKQKKIDLDIALADQNMNVNFLAPLKEGKYTVRWKIIGADGHPIEGENFFTVNQDVESASAGNEGAEEVVERETGTTEAALSNQQSAEAEAGPAPYGLVMALMLLIIVAAGTLIWTAKRRAD